MQIKTNTVITLENSDLDKIAKAISNKINNQEPDMDFVVENLDLGSNVKVQVDCELEKVETEYCDKYDVWKAEITGELNGLEIDEFKYSVNYFEDLLHKMHFEIERND